MTITHGTQYKHKYLYLTLWKGHVSIKMIVHCVRKATGVDGPLNDCLPELKKYLNSDICGFVSTGQWHDEAEHLI